MGTNEIEIAAVKVKVTVIDSPNLVVSYISELESLIYRGRRLVGVDIIKTNPGYFGLNCLLLLCVGTRCLVLQLQNLGCIPISVGELLADATICFVVEIGHLAARILKNRSLEKCDLAELGDKVEMKFSMEFQGPVFPDWNALVFSMDEVKYLVLKSLIQSPRVVGIDLKLNTYSSVSSSTKDSLLLLCVGTRCLVVQMHRLPCFPKILSELYGDNTICFVGKETTRQLIKQESYRLILSPYLFCKGDHKIVEGIGLIAARVLKDRRLEKCSLAELSNKVGLNFGDEIQSLVIPWDHVVFTIDEVKFVVHDVYRCYALGNKLIGML
ncbi:hypothetical protein CCACVL1_27892 [Corchorus capsularis]|uniref:3'-5' exonuclease domain-containing protein n=1 Tax=Corchorus capsularis TaxID=210143 RepID=A0A1R3G8D2_COCAP|nr:hypothetical protein CCACVL1_27892 [Corchorus capsularis]